MYGYLDSRLRGLTVTDDGLELVDLFSNGLFKRSHLLAPAGQLWTDHTAGSPRGIWVASSRTRGNGTSIALLTTTGCCGRISPGLLFFIIIVAANVDRRRGSLRG